MFMLTAKHAQVLLQQGVEYIQGFLLIRWRCCAGDATWSVSTGLGACIAGAVYEVGRPKRYTAEEAAQLDAEWRDFGAVSQGIDPINPSCIM
jgi:hypothetical protein